MKGLHGSQSGLDGRIDFSVRLTLGFPLLPPPGVGLPLLAPRMTSLGKGRYRLRHCNGKTHGS